MPSESTFWKYIKDKLPVQAHFQRHEDICASGIPDVSYGWNGVHGWIELKFYPKWKKKDCDHINTWTKEQRLWLRKRQKAGGHCFLFVKIEKDYLLFGEDGIDQLLELYSKKVLLQVALKHWHGSINIDELEEILCA